MKNKRGQGMSITTLVLLVLAIIVLVVVVLGFTKGWDYIFDKIGLLPDDLTSAAEACKTYAGSGSLALSYCQYRELTVDGKKQWMNCDHVHAKAVTVLGADKVGFSTQSCVVNEVAYCKQLEAGENYKESTIVNGATCKELSVAK